MSQTTVEQFVQLAAKDTALQEQLKATTSLQDFQTKMVDLGKQKGCTFVKEDVASYMQAKVAQTTGQSPSGKLTEQDLETVGGGTTPGCIVWGARITGAVITWAVSP